jgi:hypothetical protein
VKLGSWNYGEKRNGKEWEDEQEGSIRYNWSVSWKDGGNGSRETEGGNRKGRLIYKRSAS